MFDCFFHWWCRKRIVFAIGPVTERKCVMAKVKATVGSFNLGDSQSVDLSLQLEDAAGNPVDPSTITTPPAWSVDNGALLTLTPSSDDTKANAKAAGPLGTATVSVAVTLANGQVVPGQLQIVLVSGPASQVAIVPGVPA
jgi:hypothetical protein